MHLQHWPSSTRLEIQLRTQHKPASFSMNNGPHACVISLWTLVFAFLSQYNTALTPFAAIINIALIINASSFD